MASSKAATVEEYLAEFPVDRREVIAAVRKVVLKNLPKGYREGMNFGMIAYEIPLERYPVTYNKQPLMYAALAAQKNYYAVYLMSIYGTPERERKFREAYTATGEKLDCGKACVRFKTLENLPLDVIGQEIASVSVESYITFYEKIKPAKPSKSAKPMKAVKKKA